MEGDEKGDQAFYCLEQIISQCHRVVGRVVGRVA